MIERTREPTRKASDRARLPYPTLAAISTIGYRLLSGVARNFLYVLTGVPMSVATLAGLRWRRPAWPWHTVVCGLSFFVAASAVFFIVYESVPGVPAPFPPIAGAFYLGSFSIAAVGATCLVRSTAGRGATIRAEGESLPICPVPWERCPTCSSAPGGVSSVVVRFAERLIHGNIERLEKAA